MSERLTNGGEATESDLQDKSIKGCGKEFSIGGRSRRCGDSGVGLCNECRQVNKSEGGVERMKDKYYQGMFSSLKHNILLMLNQIEGNLEYASNDDKELVKDYLEYIEKRVKEIKDVQVENHESDSDLVVEKVKHQTVNRKVAGSIPAEVVSPEQDAPSKE